MKRVFLASQLSLALITALSVTAVHADDSRAYSIIAPQPVMSMAAARLSGATVQREAAIASAQRSTASAVSALGAQVRNPLQHVGAISFADLTESQVRALKARGYTVERVGTKRIIGASVAAETIPYGISKVRAPEAWPLSSGAGVKVCVIDTGVDRNHPDLAPNFVEGRSFVGSGENSTGADVHGHGTHVAGTIAAANNGSGVVGVAHQARIYAAAVFDASGSASEEDILQGVDWCVSKNADIFSMSYGGSETSSAETAAYQAAQNSGALLVAASGNDGATAPIGYPAAYDFVVAVGATDSSDTIASFSQRGPKLDVVAPGVSVVSTARGSGTTTMSGTSMATPHVSGVAAVVLAAKPELSNVQLTAILQQTAVDRGTPGFDNTYGYGRVDVKAALDSLGNGGNLSPVAGFSAAQSSADPLSFSFTDSSTDPDGDAIVSRNWDFGDGSSSTATNPSHTYSAAGSYTVKLTVTDARGATGTLSQTVQAAPPQGGALTRDVPKTNLNGAAGAETKFYLDVPANASNLKFTTSGGSGDADLYVRFGAEPTSSAYDCRPYVNGNNETCSFASASTGRYYVTLRGYSAYSGVQLLATYDVSGGGGSSFENTADYAIPDNSTVGARSPITVSRSGSAGSVSVALNITHTYIGDLVVDVIAPNGARYNVHNRSGGSADNIIKNVTINAGSQTSQGLWRLEVKDRARYDTGFINSWKLTFSN